MSDNQRWISDISRTYVKGELAGVETSTSDDQPAVARINALLGSIGSSLELSAVIAGFLFNCW